MKKVTVPYYYLRTPEEVCKRLNEVMEELGDRYISHSICMAPSTQFNNEYFLLFVTYKTEDKDGNRNN